MMHRLSSPYLQAQNRQYFLARKFASVLVPVALRSVLQVASKVPLNRYLYSANNFLVRDTPVPHSLRKDFS